MSSATKAPGAEGPSSSPNQSEVPFALYRLKRECELSGLADKPGFDAWISLANEVLGSWQPAMGAFRSQSNTTAPTPTDRAGEDVFVDFDAADYKPDLASAIAAEIMSLKWTHCLPATDSVEDEIEASGEHCNRYGDVQEVVNAVLSRARAEPHTVMLASAPAPSDPAGAGGDLGELAHRLREEVINREARRREILLVIEDQIGTAWTCRHCGYSTYHSMAYECADCGADMPDLHRLAFKLHARNTDNEDLINEVRAAFDEEGAYRSGQLVASTPGQKGAGGEKTGAPAPGVQWSAWSEIDADSDPSDPGVTYCTEWFVGRWPIGAEEPDCRILIGTSRSAEIIARRVAERLTSILNTDRIRAAPSGWRTDCFRTRMSEFDAAYKKACASSQPKDWMDAALFAQQFRNVAYAVLTGEAPEQEIPNKLRLKPCPWEEEHLCSYPKCNCAPDREPDPPASCDEHPQKGLDHE